MLHVLSSLLQDIMLKFPGNNSDIHFLCPHCSLNCIEPPHKWPAEQALRGLIIEDQGFVTCPKEQMPIAGGLIQFLRKGI